MKRHHRGVRKRKVVKRRVVFYWRYTELGANKLGIECPHCGGKTVVNKTRWVNFSQDFTTRGCTYCDWFATIPIELLSARDPRRDTYEGD